MKTLSTRQTCSATYVAALIEVIEISVGQGFATSIEDIITKEDQECKSKGYDK